MPVRKTRRTRKIVRRGDGFGNLLPMLLPIIKKILPALGLAAATGAVSGLSNRAVRGGKGVKRKPGRPRKPRGSGLLLGKNSPFNNIPLLGLLL